MNPKQKNKSYHSNQMLYIIMKRNETRLPTKTLKSRDDAEVLTNSITKSEIKTL